MKIKHYDKFMNENVPGEFSYSTTLTSQEVDLYNVEKGEDDEIEVGNTIVDWELDLDQRKTGINSIGVSINRVRGSYTLNGDVDKDFDSKGDDKWHMTAEYSGEFKFGGSLYPLSAEIDFSAKKITVEF